MSSIGLQLGNLLPQIVLAYMPSIHYKKLSQPIMQERGWSQDAQKFNEKVQVCIDKRMGECAFKSNDYLLGFHLVKPMFGYSKESCDRASNVLGDVYEDRMAKLEDEIKRIEWLIKEKPDEAASTKLAKLDKEYQALRKEYLEVIGPIHICHPTDFYYATEEILFRRIVFLLNKNIKLNYKHGQDPATIHPRVQQLTHFALNALHHAVQDFKHLEGPLSANGVNSLEHTFTHVCSDINPPKDMLERSKVRTHALLDRFKDRLIAEFGKELGVRILANIKSFKFPKGKGPSDMIPEFKTIRRFLPSFPGDTPDDLGI